MTVKKRILSGMRPSGRLHIGHLVGALNNWVRLQDSYDCFYMVADWHALMSEYGDPKGMAQNSYEMVRDFVASGLDPERCAIFVQSHVPEHLELAMVFSDITPLAWVERCPTYKEQLREIKGRELATYGFLGYPVLQAADIALYKANAVPVGFDQLPHLELTREIIRRFNGLFAKKVFPEPEPILAGTAKLLGMDNRKMSKSYANFISLSDTAAAVEKKVASMITDPARQRLKDKGNPEVCNVYSYFSTFANPAETENVKDWCVGAGVGCTQCKKSLADVLNSCLEPIRARRARLSNSYVESIVKEGRKKAGKVASETMTEVRKLIDFVM